MMRKTVLLALVVLAFVAGPAFAQVTVLESGTGVTPVFGNQLTPQVYAITVDSTAYVAADTTVDIKAITVPAKTKIVGVYTDLTTTFACASVCTTSTLSMSIISGGGGTLLASFDADAAAAQFGLVDADLGTLMVRSAAVQGGYFSSWTGTVQYSFRLVSGTGNIGNGSSTNLSQGSVTVYLELVQFP